VGPWKEELMVLLRGGQWDWEMVETQGTKLVSEKGQMLGQGSELVLGWEWAPWLVQESE